MNDVKEAVERGLEAMSWDIVDSGRIKVPSSKPAVYNFIGKPELDTKSFENAIHKHGFTVNRATTGETFHGEFYCYVDVTTDHYKRVKLKVWNDRVNIYPDEEPPDKYELSRILHAIEDGFNGEIEYNEQED